MGSRIIVDPVCGNVKGDRQFLDGQGAAVAVRYWAQWSPGHGLEFERLAAQHRAEFPGRAEIEFIRDTPPFVSTLARLGSVYQSDGRIDFLALPRPFSGA